MRWTASETFTRKRDGGQRRRVSYPKSSKPSVGGLIERTELDVNDMRDLKDSLMIETEVVNH